MTIEIRPKNDNDQHVKKVEKRGSMKEIGFEEYPLEIEDALKKRRNED